MMSIHPKMRKINQKTDQNANCAKCKTMQSAKLCKVQDYKKCKTIQNAKLCRLQNAKLNKMQN